MKGKELIKTSNKILKLNVVKATQANNITSEE